MTIGKKTAKHKLNVLNEKPLIPLMLKNCEAKTLMNLNPEASGLNGKKKCEAQT